LCYLEVPEVYSFLQRHYYGYCLKRAAKNSIAIVTVSNTTKNAIVSHFHYPENRILVIPNQVDQNFLEYYPNESDVKETEKYFGQSDCKILYTGGFENRKNVERLLLGIQNLRVQFPNLKLCITGDQEQAWSKILHKFPDLNDSVKMTGKVTSKQLKTLYLIADVVVYPSLSEGYGRACIEAMATGTPLACSDISIFHEVAGDYAIYFDPLDINSISNGITTAKNSSRKAPIVNPEDISSSDLHKLKELLLEGGSLEPKR
jgi:glycosyltransferase involved in cell wall biosynthesis